VLCLPLLAFFVAPQRRIPTRIAFLFANRRLTTHTNSSTNTKYTSQRLQTNRHVNALRRLKGIRLPVFEKANLVALKKDGLQPA